MFIFIVLFISCYYFFKILKFFSCSGMFRDVPECSGMFRNVPACSGMFHVPSFIDGPSEMEEEKPFIFAGFGLQTRSCLFCFQMMTFS